MSTTIEDITRKTARLARIEIDDATVAHVAPQLEAILGLFEELQEINTDDVEPLANVIGQDLALREDAVTDGNCTDKVLSNAKDVTQSFYGVPKVVE